MGSWWGTFPVPTQERKAELGQAALTQSPRFASWPAHPYQPAATRCSQDQTPTSASLEPLHPPVHPRSPAHSLTSICHPGAGSWQAALAPLHFCSQRDASRSNAQFPQMSPNCACLRLRKEAGVPPPSLSGSGPPHSPFPPTPLRLANLAIGFRTGGYLQRQSVLHLRMSAMGTRHTQGGPTHRVPRQGTVGSRRWLAFTSPSLLPTPQEEVTSQRRSQARWPHRRMALLAKLRLPG